MLNVVPTTLRAANAFVERLHRHHGRVVGQKFSVAVADPAGEIRGVAIAGRPVARHLDDGLTIEVLRVATDGARNACSMLYRACWRSAREMGYRRLVTFTLDTEPGTSLRAAGLRLAGQTDAESWSRPSRPRTDKHPVQRKNRWQIP